MCLLAKIILRAPWKISVIPGCVFKQRLFTVLSIILTLLYKLCLKRISSSPSKHHISTVVILLCQTKKICSRTSNKRTLRLLPYFLEGILINFSCWPHKIMQILIFMVILLWCACISCESKYTWHSKRILPHICISISSFFLQGSKSNSYTTLT